MPVESQHCSKPERSGIEVTLTYSPGRDVSPKNFDCPHKYVKFGEVYCECFPAERCEPFNSLSSIASTNLGGDSTPLLFEQDGSASFSIPSDLEARAHMRALGMRHL